MKPKLKHATPVKRVRVFTQASFAPDLKKFKAENRQFKTSMARLARTNGKRGVLDFLKRNNYIFKSNSKGLEILVRVQIPEYIIRIPAGALRFRKFAYTWNELGL